MSILKTGVKVKAIWWPGENSARVQVGKNQVKAMAITMENGQMAEVPWVVQENDDGTIGLHNCAMLGGMELEHKIAKGASE